MTGEIDCARQTPRDAHGVSHHVSQHGRVALGGLLGPFRRATGVGTV
jgi:hypothetical protein